MSTLAIIGAGRVGGALGRRLAALSHDVRFGLRDPSGAAPAGRAASVEAALDAADVVLLAVPGDVAPALAEAHAERLAGRIVVDATNPVSWSDGPVWHPPAAGSNAAAVAAAAAGARVVKAFNTFGAETHEDPRYGAQGATVPYAGDDAEAKAEVSALAEALGYTPVDAGPLRNAALLENLAVLWIHLAAKGGQGRQFALNLHHRPA
jgi:hypothetical protein